MKLTFFGAARAVTGSCYCVDVAGKKLLIDCGLQQGRDEHDNNALDFDASSIDYILVTHAHIDHSGRIPLMVKQGFSGKVITTRLTGELLSIMLRDSAHIQESDAEWKNQKGKRAGKPVVEPLYTMDDALRAIELIETFEYHQTVPLFDGVKFRFVDAGHLLGSAHIELWLTEDDVERKMLFSGDIGNVDQPIIRDPEFVKEADYVIMESTYGDRNHDPVKQKKDITQDYAEKLAEIIQETFDAGGNVIIPSFAVGRTQELLYALREMKDKKVVKNHGDFTVCVDSPLAIEATKIFSGDLRGYLDEEAIEVLRDGEALFTFPGFMVTSNSEESKQLNLDATPKVIISASGMCDAGRIRHHLKHNLWREESSVVFVGYQAEGSLGRQLIEGRESVKLFGEKIAVKASIHNLSGLSSHADRDHLLDWIDHVSPKPMHVFVAHGDFKVTEIFAQSLRERGFDAHAPLYKEVYDLKNNTMLEAGVLIEKKKGKEHTPSAAYLDLEINAMGLLTFIREQKGHSNKELRKKAKELEQLLGRWKK